MKSKQIMIAGLMLGMAAGAFAQAKPEDVIRYRQSVMNVRGHVLGPLVAMAQGKIPYNAAVVAKNAQILEVLAELGWDAFPPGTDKGAPTKADPKIWMESAKFKEAAEREQEMVTKLGQTLKVGDEKAVKAAIGEVGKTCKSCHDDFRTKNFRG